MADDDGSDGLMGWIGDALESPKFLKTRMAFGIVVGIAATWLFTYLLLQMERQTTSYNAAVMEAAVGERDTQLELEEDTQQSGEYVQATDDDDDMTIKSNSPRGETKTSFGDTMYKLGDTRRRLLSTQQHVQIIAHVLILILFNYLLLVFLPGSIWLSFFAILIVWVLALQSYMRDELGRRRRYDRILTMMALFSIIAGCMTLVTFCHLSLKEGNIYEGPARITGYDSSSYANKDGSTMRADLQVSWGGMWGCPDVGGKQCTATVQGALCETKYEVPGDNNNNRRRRRAKQGNVVVEVQEYQKEQLDADMNGSAKQEMVSETMSPMQGEGNVVEEEDVENQELNEELNTETSIHEEMEGTLETEVNILESNSTDTQEEEDLTDLAVGEAYGAGAQEGEVEGLKDENQKLQGDLDAEEELNGELEQEIEDMEGGGIVYSYDDETFEDDYWQKQDWDSIWGEYACEDLFSGDLDGVEGLNMNTAPGDDQWPTVNIYGSCSTCTAYILDYYSTEHFQNILSYEHQSYLYMVFGLGLMILAAISALLERARPAKDKASILLSHDGGVPA
jgi:hypothetical protein